MSNEFKINECKKYIYIKGTPDSFVIICLYIHDMLIMESCHVIIIITKKMLTKNFNMKDMSLIDIILTMKVTKTFERIVLAQYHYVEMMLRKFNAYKKIFPL